jgi:hypothetical protein
VCYFSLGSELEQFSIQVHVYAASLSSSATSSRHGVPL